MHRRHEVTRVVHNIRQLTLSQSSLPTNKLISQPLEKISTASRPTAPSDDALKQRVRRLKGKHRAKCVPRTRENINFTDKFLFTLRSEPFLLHDYGKETSDRMIVFATQRSLKVCKYVRLYVICKNFWYNLAEPEIETQTQNKRNENQSINFFLLILLCNR